MCMLNEEKGGVGLMGGTRLFSKYPFILFLFLNHWLYDLIKRSEAKVLSL